MTMDPITEIKPGLPVHTVDGDRLGDVKEVQGDRFKVSAPLQPDYWLRVDDVQAFTIERVTLEFAKDQLGSHKVDAPN